MKRILASLLVLILVLSHGGVGLGYASVLEGTWVIAENGKLDVRKVIEKSLSFDQRITFRNLQSGAMIVRYKKVKPSEEQIEEVLYFIQSVPVEPTLVQVKRTEVGLDLTYDNGEVRSLSHVESLPRQSTADPVPHTITLAGWEEGMFVVETRRTDGLNILEIVSFDTFHIKHIILTSSWRYSKPFVFERNYSYK